MAPLEMTGMRALALVAAGGALGSSLRHLAGVALPAREGFPWGTLVVNLAGSFALGLLLGWGLTAGRVSPEARLLLATGVLGGFTTMSTFAWETVALAGERPWRAAMYAMLTFGGCVGMAALGRAASRLLAGASG